MLEFVEIVPAIACRVAVRVNSGDSEKLKLPPQRQPAPIVRPGADSEKCVVSQAHIGHGHRRPVGQFRTENKTRAHPLSRG